MSLKTERIGQKRMTKNGLWEMECIEYNKANDITIRIQVEIDGVIYNVDKKTTYTKFNNGTVDFGNIEINNRKYRKCRKCGEIFEITEFKRMLDFYYPNNMGYSPICRKCTGNNKGDLVKEWNNKRDTYYLKNKEVINNIINNFEFLYDDKGLFTKKELSSFNNSAKARINKFKDKYNYVNDNTYSKIEYMQLIEMIYFFDFKCSYSDRDINKNNKAIDHIVPLANKYGSNKIWNLVLADEEVNHNKNASSPLDWYLEENIFNEDRLNKIIAWQIYAFNKWATENDELILITDLLED